MADAMGMILVLGGVGGEGSGAQSGSVLSK